MIDKKNGQKLTRRTPINHSRGGIVWNVNNQGDILNYNDIFRKFTHKRRNGNHAVLDNKGQRLNTIIILLERTSLDWLFIDMSSGFCCCQGYGHGYWQKIDSSTIVIDMIVIYKSLALR